MRAKTESIEEFLARGGTIKKLAAGESAKLPTTRRSAGGDPVVILSMEDAEIFYGEGKPKAKKKSTPKAGIDLSQLPESLKSKFLAKLKDRSIDGEENN